MTVGGNDVFGPARTTCLSPVPALRATCAATVGTQLEQVRANLTATLSALTAAAGRRTEVVVTTYDNPIGSCVLATLAPVSVALAEVVLEGGTLPGLLQLQDGLDDVVEQVAAATGAQVADLHGTLTGDELVGGPDCLHPSTAGHADIARTVYARLAR